MNQNEPGERVDVAHERSFLLNKIAAIACVVLLLIVLAIGGAVALVHYRRQAEQRKVADLAQALSRLDAQYRAALTPVDVTAVDLARAYHDDPEDAAIEYRGKFLRVEEVVAAVDADHLEVLLHGGTGADGSELFVRAVFESDAPSAEAEFVSRQEEHFVEGSTVYIRGHAGFFSGTQVELQSASFDE